MLSLHLLTVCAAVAAAAALPVDPKTVEQPPPPPPPTTPEPSKEGSGQLKPDFGFEIKSRQSQSGTTSGGASVSSTGSSQGAVTGALNLATEGYKLDLSAVGNSGVSGSGVSIGDSGFRQKTQTNSEAGSKGTRRAQVVTGTKGQSISKGNAGTVQKAGANVGFQGAQAVRFTQPGQGQEIAVSVDKKAGASSSSGHQSATRGSGSIGVENVGGTELRRVNPARDPTDPDDSLSSDSQLRQTGKTTGTSSLTASGSTQGGGGARFNLWSPTFNNSRDFAGNTNVAGNGIASGNGFFVQGVQANTELVSTKDGLKVKTGTRGAGTTGGNAGLIEKAGANGKATDVAIITLADGSKQVQLVNSQKTTAATSSGLAASSKGDGRFRVDDKRETEVRVKPVDLNSEALKVPPAPQPGEGSKYIDQYIPSDPKSGPSPQPKPDPQPKPEPEPEPKPEPEPEPKPEPEPEPEPKPNPSPKGGYDKKV